MRQTLLNKTIVAMAVLQAMGASAETVVQTPTVEIIGTTPLPGIGLSREQVPANIQTLGGSALLAEPGRPLTDTINRNLASVFLTEIQNNPLQPDLNYRGFTASPLLGTPQGMSVYMDGVRLNQPFGDVVSWDLIPRSAIADMQLMPGSNPLFGLNTLGGAVAIQTKDGYSHPGSAVQLLGGTYGRASVEFEHGGHNSQGLHWFLTGNLLREDGWRDSSPTDAGQLFGKLGWRDAQTDLALTVAVARNKLTGNGLQEYRLLERNYDSVYTKPDETTNRSAFFNLTGKHNLTDDLLFSGNAYYRKIRTSTFNGDMNDDALDQSVYQPNAADRAALAAAGYSGYPNSGANASNTPFPYWRCIAQVLQKDEPAEKCNGLINRTETTQENYGWTAQLTGFGKLGQFRNQWTGGVGYDASRMHFKQSTQLGYINPDHSITGLNAFADGVTGGNIDGAPYDNRVDLSGKARTWSIYGTDTISLKELVHLTVSGRYNQTVVRNRDSITPGGGAGSLDGDHRFSRFNPAIGITVTPQPAFNVYAGYNEGSRTPTAIELGCADPANPCKLPNAMAGDPPLKQVVTKTWETGVRGRLGDRLRWNAGVFRADNFDDILFVADNAAGYGYFKNFGKTRRQGIELGLTGDGQTLDWGMSYTLTDATFRSGETVNGEANSSADANGNIAIRSGDRLPLVPRHLFKAFADWRINAAWSVGVGMRAVSGSTARGNENGAHQGDGVHYVGSGRSAGYSVFDLSGKYRANQQLSFFVVVNNLFDRKYASAAQLGATGFTANGNFIARPFNPTNAGGGDNSPAHSTFYAPGAPRTAWVGLRYEFGDK